MLRELRAKEMLRMPLIKMETKKSKGPKSQ